MASSNNLYSYKGKEPEPLPHEINWIDENGYLISRTGIDTFTDEEILKAGYIGPFIKPFFHEKTQQLNWNSESLTYSVEDLYDPEPIIDNQPEPEQAPRVTEESFWHDIRLHRSILLLQSDWAVNDSLVDVNLTPEKRNEWIEYRQKLRDIPQTISYSSSYGDDTSYPTNITKLFPEVPKN